MKSPKGIGRRFTPYRRFKGISVIPNSLMRYPGLSHGAKLVWARLAQYAGKDGRAYPSVVTLGDEVGLKKRQTQKYLAELETKGFIERESGPQANSYYFLVHEIFNEEVRKCALGGAGMCSSATHDSAPKETKNKIKRKETTTSKSGRRSYFDDLSKEEQVYIELRTAHDLEKGKIHTSPSAFKAGLVKIALRGDLNMSDLQELEAWKRGDPYIPKVMLDSVTLDRIKDYQRHDGRSPKELCKLIQKRIKEGANEFWGLPINEVYVGLRSLFL